MSDTLLSAGIDVGSAAIKVALMEDYGDGNAELLASRTERVRRRDPGHVAETIFDAVLQEAGVERGDLQYVATTGEGEMVSFRTGHFYGMTTHSRGGLFLDPEARAVIDIGSLHTRAVLMDDRAKVLGYRMTSQCASGSGQFLENISRYLGVTIEEIGPLSLEADDPEVCSSICAVLAETDVINMVSRGISIPNILKGIHQSMAGRYMRLVVASGANGVVLVTGGISRDVGLVKTLQEEAEAKAAGKKPVNIEMRTHPQSVLAGAIGAAMWGAFRVRKLRERGSVLGGSAV